MSEPGYPPPPADHRVKITHLVFGLLFLGAAGTWALGASDAISGEHLTILAPALLIGAGVIGLAASLASGRNRRRAATPYAASVPESTPESTPADITEQISGDVSGDTEPTQPVTRPGTEPEDDHTEEIR